MYKRLNLNVLRIPVQETPLKCVQNKLKYKVPCTRRLHLNVLRIN